MSALSSLSEKQRYHLSMGELMDSLLTLETAIRKFLCRVNADGQVESWETLAQWPYGKKVSENAFTNGDSFGELVKEYNATFTSKKSARKYAINDSVVATRNTLAHGRVIEKSPGAVPALVNFSARKKDEDFVKVTCVINEPAGWIADKLPLITRQIKKVRAASEKSAGK